MAEAWTLAMPISAKSGPKVMDAPDTSGFS